MNIYVRELSRELGRRGVQLDIFTRRQDVRSPDVVDLDANARVIHVEAGPRRPIDKYEVVDYLAEFTCGVQRFRALNGLGYDLIHAHYWLSGRVATVLKEVWGAPLVVMFHTLARVKNRVAVADEREQDGRGDVEARLMANASRIVAATESDRADMVRYYHAAPHNVTVISGGADLSRFRPGRRSTARTELGFQTHVPLVLFVGRLQQLKGVDLLLEAFARLTQISRRGRHAKLLLIGGLPPGAPGRRAAEDRQAHRLARLASQLGIQDRVTFVGAVPHDQLPRYYQAADVTVVPSMHESFGLVALESLACGTPVVASRVGGLVAIVRDGQTGFLVPWRDPRLFADRIGVLLDDAGLREAMARSAAQAARGFSWTAVGDKVLQVYQQLITPGAAIASDR
jgi:D-inositol-3-phosphate glycosyltransferase